MWRWQSVKIEVKLCPLLEQLISRPSTAMSAMGQIERLNKEWLLWRLKADALTEHIGIGYCTWQGPLDPQTFFSGWNSMPRSTLLPTDTHMLRANFQPAVDFAPPISRMSLSTRQDTVRTVKDIKYIVRYCHLLACFYTASVLPVYRPTFLALLPFQSLFLMEGFYWKPVLQFYKSSVFF